MNLNIIDLKIKKILNNSENLNTSFDFIKLNITSPQRIRFWSEKKLINGIKIGLITSTQTFDFKTFKPKIGGIFCEQIFGPIKNWICQCGKYNGSLTNVICENCLVEFTESRVRRYRMGFIELHYPIIHLWYLNIKPNYIYNFLRLIISHLTLENLNQLIYLNYNTSKIYNLNYSKLNELNLFLSKPYKNYHGNELIKSIYDNINLNFEIFKIRSNLTNLVFNQSIYLSNDKKFKIQMIRILESFILSKIEPSWMLFTILPVLPPSLRPLIKLQNSQILSSDINQLYINIILINQLLLDYLNLDFIDESIIINYQKKLQENVDYLIENKNKKINNIFQTNNTNLKNLSTFLTGKYGYFRQNILGKRTDFSGRSVITVNPNLRLNQCGLPYEIIAEFLKFILINLLIDNIHFDFNIILNEYIKKKNIFIWSLFSILIKNYSILLNRAPTLHRLGIQSFEPLLIIDKSIHLHPVLCTSFNADFDGDQMGIYLPLSEASQFELKKIMKPCYNLLSPSNSTLIIKPTQDMVIGCYYLTLMIKQSKFFINYIFYNNEYMLITLFLKKINLHTPILIMSLSNNFNIFYNNNKFQIKCINNNFFIDNKNINILKILKNNLFNNIYYFLTNIGIFIIKFIDKNNYFILYTFLETTPGRILFLLNINQIIKNYVY